MYFNNCDSKSNGEYGFFRFLVDNLNIKTIFDVGSRYDSDFLEFEGEVHYFEPVKEFIEKLKKKQNHNKKSHFNNFGLGNNNEELFYYPKYQSFYDRVNSCKVSDDKNKFKLVIKKGLDYMRDNNIDKIDFLKIDTEGFELNVLKGFGYYIRNFKFIQFEYGGTFLDNNTKLIDVVEYLRGFGFDDFGYLFNGGVHKITDFTDHYQYCNIVCFNKNL